MYMFSLYLYYNTCSNNINLTKMSQNTDPNTKNIIVGPDYGQMMNLSTNGEIMKAFMTKLFDNNTKFNLRTITCMTGNFIVVLLLKIFLEDSKTFLDKFKFTNLNFFRHMYQSIRYSTTKYDFILVSGKWKYDDTFISVNTLTPFLEQKSIYISQPATYYYEYRSYLIKVIIANNKITFVIPSIDSIKRYVEIDIIRKNEEVVFGGKTTMSRVTVTPSNVIKIEPVQLAYAFETDNYLHLKESISTSFMVESVMKFNSVPFCVNFDGAPGTGKTTFGSYIASSGLFDRIIVCNLVQASNTNFQDLITNLERQITTTSPKEKKSDGEPETILLIIDEIDKWLNSYTDNQIQKLREDARGKKQLQDGKNQGTVIEGYEKLTESEENDKRIHIKNEFLDQLYKLVDGHMLSDIRKYVIIFNTNHFHRLFENVDSRFDALRDRFTKYKFDKIGKPEIIKYFDRFSERLKLFDGDETVPRTKKELFKESVQQLCTYNINIYDEIPSTIKITYRYLHKLLRNHNFNIERTIRALATDYASDFFQPNDNQVNDNQENKSQVNNNKENKSEVNDNQESNTKYEINTDDVTLV